MAADHDPAVELLADVLCDLDRTSPHIPTFREYVAAGSRTADRYRERARAVLDALRAAGRLTTPGVWQLSPDPGADITEAWDREGYRWVRVADRMWCRAGSEGEPWWSRTYWPRLVVLHGPLSATPPEGGDRG
jgi:hypothetical protein